MKIAQKVQAEKDAQHIINGDATQTEFADNTYVLVNYTNNTIKKGPPNKLNTFLKGPLRVVRHTGPTYTLENLVTGKREMAHVTRLRTFPYNEENINPIDIANRDAFATVVDQIISHSPEVANYKNIKRSELTFQVRWRGLSEEYDRYLPYKELRNNPRLHEYLQARNMRSFIPPEHK